MLAPRFALAASLCVGVAIVPLAASAAIYYVGGDGASNENDGSSGSPWATLQHAADEVEAGDTVMVRPGNYQGFFLEASGTSEAPIVFSAMSGVVVDEDNPTTVDGINIEGADWVVIEGFEVTDASRAGIRAVLCEHVTIRDNNTHDNFQWGILTGFCDDLLIENNRASGSEDEHGIYVSNSGDRPVIRGNVIFDNNANGIHMNGDVFTQSGGEPADGIISEALVENNVIFNNGGAGGSGINCDGVVDSVIRNNLIYDALASGISLYQIDGGAPSTGNQVTHNTVVVASDGRWALNIQDGSSGNTVLNNIFFSEHSFRGAIDLCDGCEVGLVSDYNVVIDRFSIDEVFIDLSEWRTDTGQDANSIVATPAETFADYAGDDYRLASESPARDAAPAGVEFDLLGVRRPVGAGFDIGAYEYCVGDECNGGGGGDPLPDTGGDMGADTGSDVAADAADDLGGAEDATGSPDTTTDLDQDDAPDDTEVDPPDVAGDAVTGDTPSADTHEDASDSTGADGAADRPTSSGSSDDSGCGCRSASGPAAASWLFIALVALALKRRRSSVDASPCPK